MAANTNFEKYKSDGSKAGNLLEWVDARFPATAMAFEVEDTPLPDASPEPEPPSPPAGGRPKLQRVK